jgi:hypothetical protein
MKRLLIAGVVLAGLSGVIWWSEKQEAAKSEALPAKTSPQLLALSQTDIQQMELQRAGEAATILVRGEDGKWSMTVPAAFPLDQASVSAIADTAVILPSERLVDENLTDLTAYGLEPPVISLKLRMKNGQTHHLRIGGETPDRSAIYATVDGDKRLFAIATTKKETFDKSYRDLREKHLLSFDIDQASRVELMVSGKQPLEFSRSNAVWQIFRPRPMRADGLQVDELVRLLHEAEMDPAATDSEAAAAFAKGRPLATAKVTDPAGIKTLDVRKFGDDYFARSSVVPGVFKVTPALGTGVNKDLEDFQSKKLFDFAFDDPSKVYVKSKDDEKTFEKNGTEWLANGRTMDSVGVQALIDKLRDLVATGLIDVTRMGPAEVEITVVSQNGKRTEEVELAPSGADYLARRGAEAGLYRVDGSALAAVLQAVKDVQQAKGATK